MEINAAMKVAGIADADSFIENLDESVEVTDLPGIGSMYQGNFSEFFEAANVAIYSPLASQITLLTTAL